MCESQICRMPLAASSLALRLTIMSLDVNLVHWQIIGRLCTLFRLHLNHEFTRAQVKLTRAQARVGPGVDMPLTITDARMWSRSTQSQYTYK